jgi:DNA end-binding protein Ku
MPEEPEGAGQVIDLMEALRASLEKRSAPASAPQAPAEARKPPKRAAEASQPAAKKAARK